MAREAAAVLEVSPLDCPSAIAGELIKQVDLGSIVFRVPSLSEFRTLTAFEENRVKATADPLDQPGWCFKF